MSKTSLLGIFNAHLDMVWMIADIDGQPLYPDGRQPAGHWRKKLDKPEYQPRCVEYM